MFFLTSEIKVAKVTNLRIQELPFLIYFAFVTLVPLIQLYGSENYQLVR